MLTRMWLIESRNTDAAEGPDAVNNDNVSTLKVLVIGGLTLT